jgi:selenocysteine lyase/cysteine desulfurase
MPLPDPDISTPSGMNRRDFLAATVTATGLAAVATPGPALAQPTSEIPAITRELWQWVRVQPVADSRQVWLDSASSTPTLRVAMAEEYRAREMQSGNLAATTASDYWSTESQRLAARFAAFAGCSEDEIVFTRGTGEGLAMIAAGLDLANGDEVVTTTQEHPAALSPWLFLARRRGVVVKQVDIPVTVTSPEQIVALISAACTDRTRVLAFSHIQYGDGAVLPVRELCQLARQRNIVSVVDGAQAFGMLEYELRDLGCDYYATGFHKWLAGCHGTGMLYVRRESLDRLWPSEPRGIDASPPVFAPTESAGQATTPAALHKLGNVVPSLWPALRGVEAALNFQEQVHRGRIEARIRELAIYARMRLQRIPAVELLTSARPGLWAGILTFRVIGRRAADIASTLALANGVYLRVLKWPKSEDGALRASLHIFNSSDDIEKFGQALQQLVK